MYTILFFFFNDTATTEIYTLSLHDALPICHRGGERLLDRLEGRDLPLDLEVLDREAAPPEETPDPRLTVGEARRAAGLLPLVGVERHEGEHPARTKDAPRPLGDRVRHAEVGHDHLGLERRVLLDLHVADDEPDVREPSGRRALPRLGDRPRVAVDADDGVAEGAQRERERPRARAHVEHRQLLERLRSEELEEGRAEPLRGPTR